jgi:hypothetical protein
MKAVFQNRLIVTAQGSEELIKLAKLCAVLANEPDTSIDTIMELSNEYELNYGFYEKVELLTGNKILEN